MPSSREDIEGDIRKADDRGEAVTMIEPLLIGESSRHRALTDLALDLAQKSSGFRRSLPASLLTSLADLVLAMNCYYSNLIEGHDTYPVDIERALKNDYSEDAAKRDLQLEAKAHIAAQKWIDNGGLKGRTVTAESICEIHRRFCELLPEELLLIEDAKTKKRIRVVPGQMRHRDVAVGQHLAISPGAVPRFMQRFGEFYGNLGKTDVIISAAAAHHRWSGFTRFSTATAAWPGSCRTQRCWTRLTAARSGPWPVASPAMSRLTKPIWPRAN